MTFRAYTINGLKGEVDGGAKCVKILLGYWWVLVIGLLCLDRDYNV